VYAGGEKRSTDAATTKGEKGQKKGRAHTFLAREALTVDATVGVVDHVGLGWERVATPAVGAIRHTHGGRVLATTCCLAIARALEGVRALVLEGS